MVDKDNQYRVTMVTSDTRVFLIRAKNNKEAVFLIESLVAEGEEDSYELKTERKRKVNTIVG